MTHNRSFRFWHRWLVGISALTVIIGVVLAALAGSTWLACIERPLLSPYFAELPLPSGTAAFQRFAFGVIGGVMCGWGMFALFVARGPFARGERWAWQCFAMGITCWFVVDTVASAAAGSMLNVAGNTLYAVLFALPLVATRRAFVVASPC